MPNMNKRRIFIPKNTSNRIIFSSLVTNSDPSNEAEFAFRMNVANGNIFSNLEYSVGISGWKRFQNRDIAANLYTIMLNPSTINQPLRIRVSSGTEDLLIKYINLQLSSTVDVQPFSFQPSDISNLFVHFDSRDIEVTGTNVTQLNDLTGNDRNAVQATVASQPTLVADDSDFNGMPSVQFKGTDDNMATTSFGDQAQPNTYFIVYKLATTTASLGPLFDGITTTKINELVVTEPGPPDTYHLRIHAGGGTESFDPAVVDLDTHVAVARFNTTQSSLNVDGGVAVIDNKDVGTEVIDGITLGGEQNGTNPEHLQYKMTAFLMYNRLLTAPEVNFIGKYLGDLYGTTWTDI